MLVYSVNLALCVLLAALAQMYCNRSPLSSLASGANGSGGGLIVPHPPLIWLALVAVLCMTLVSGLRFFVGEDYLTYCVIYGDIARYGIASPNGQTVEIGFAVLCFLLSKISIQPFLMFFLTSAATNLVMVLGMRDLSRNFAFSIFLYFTTNLFYTNMNILRQGMAMAILFWGSRYLFQKRFWPFCAVAVLAALFHLSALLLIPAYLIAHQKAWSPLMWGLAAAAVAFVLLYPLVMGFVMAHIGGKYGRYEDIMLNSTQGVNILRQAVAYLPVGVAFLFRRRLRELSASVDVLVNLCYLGALIMFMSQKQVFFARLALYFLMYNLLLLPYFLRLFTDKKLNLAVGGVLAACYLIYSYTLLPLDGKALSYQNILSAPPHWEVYDMIGIK